MFRDTDWCELEQALKDCAPDLMRSQCDYLKDAFHRTEQMWSENFAQVTRVRLVMLSEAPLFGADASYFYNPHASFTAFFEFNDAEAILGQAFTKRDSRTQVLPQERKQFLLPQLAEAGFVILDMFPYAFNEKYTGAITYKRLRRSMRYRQLFERTAPHFFDRKRRLIPGDDGPVFVFRYKGTQQWLGTQLAKRGIGL